MSFDLDATATARLRSAGQRYTTQRRRLIELLADAGSPVSIPDILAGGSGLKQSSVYRNLAALEQAGVVRRLVTDEEFGRYELAEDLIGHHHHLVCSRCGKMRDVDVPEELERTLERTLDRIAKRAGFARVSHRLDLLGLCADCAAEVGADTLARLDRRPVVGWLVLFVLCAACSSATSASDSLPSARPSSPAKVQIVTPTDGDVVHGSVVDVKVRLENATHRPGDDHQYHAR